MLKTIDISKINEANLVLRHFIDISAQLLPFLNQLQKKKTLTPEEEIYKEKIIQVFEGYSSDTKTSEFLIHSNILELIKTTYLKIKSYSGRAHEQQQVLYQFFNEHKRLMDSWGYIESN